MKAEVKKIFEDARHEYTNLKDGITGALSSYRSGMERIRSGAAAYKDEDTYISEHRAALVSDTHRKIDAAEKSFCDTITGEVVPALRAALVDHMTQQPDKGFMQTLTYYQQFGVKLDAAEVKALAYDAAGNSLALRCLSSIAEKSGIKVSFPTTAKYSGIIDRLEKMAQPPLMYCPNEFLHEGVEVMGNKPLRRADGTKYGEAGPVDSLYLIMATQSVESAMKAADEAGDTWSQATVPQISEYDVIRGENGEKISREAQRAADKLTAAQQVTAEDTTAQQITTEVTEAQAQAAKAYEDFKKYYL